MSGQKLKLTDLVTGVNTVPKRTLKCKTNQDGIILSIHNTYSDRGATAARIKLEVGCFNGHGQYVALDRQGNVFVFDFVLKLYWKLPFLISKSSCIKASIWKPGTYLLGSKTGVLMELDTDKCALQRRLEVCQQRIDSIDFLTSEKVKTKTAILQTGRQAILIDLTTFTSTYRLDFETVHVTLCYAGYIPFSEFIFTFFTDDSILLWSANTLESLKTVNITKNRDLKLAAQMPSVKEFQFSSILKDYEDEVLIPEYTDGNILCYCFSRDGKFLYIGTSDCYLLVLEAQTFEFVHIFRLRDFVVKQCVAVSLTEEMIILGLTYNGKVLLMDITHNELRLLFECKDEIIALHISEDSKLLAVIYDSGECQIWSVLVMLNKLKSQRQTMAMLRSAMNENKKIPDIMTNNELLNSNVRKFLTKSKLSELLREYAHFPSRFRLLIWCSILKLPGNYDKYEELVKMPVPNSIHKAIYDFQLKDDLLKKNLNQVWTSLSHWCKVFAYSDFLPNFIFPFIKNFPNHAFIVFEILMTLISNHCYLWFELHPLPPMNYIGMIENILQQKDPSLCRFFLSKKIDSKVFCWLILSNGFSEVLDQEQWGQLWDHIFFNPPHFLIFCVVAYNIVQRDIIMHLPDKRSITYFFREQNPINMNKLLDKAYKLMITCPDSLNPTQFIKSFQPLPKGVYPLYLNYPKELLDEHESNLSKVKLEQKSIDTRIRQLEFEEIRMMSRLKDGLRDEKEVMLIREIERKYKETIREEEERLATQRKMLVLYQKEVRNKKQHIIDALQRTQRRKQVTIVESELDHLRREIESERLRHDADVIIADEDLKNREIELYAQQFDAQIQQPSLATKYRADWHRLKRERYELNKAVAEVSNTLPKPQDTINLDQIERTLDDIDKAFCKLKYS